MKFQYSIIAISLLVAIDQSEAQTAKECAEICNKLRSDNDLSVCKRAINTAPRPLVYKACSNGEN